MIIPFICDLSCTIESMVSLHDRALTNTDTIFLRKVVLNIAFVVYIPHRTSSPAPPVTPTYYLYDRASTSKMTELQRFQAFFNISWIKRDFSGCKFCRSDLLDVGLARTALAARVALQMARYRPKELWNAHLTDLFLHFACHYLGSLRELRIRRN
jgi:hypothetical protein